MRSTRILAAIAVCLAVAAALAAQPAASCCKSPGLVPEGQEPAFQDLPKAGKKCWIGEVNYFTWEFDKTPKMGTSILIVKLYDKDGKRVSDLAIAGRSDMPSMRGAHDSGQVAFKTNKAGDYLLPVSIVMPGDWEVLLTFTRNGIVIFRGRIAFYV
ncbi:MAG TPA: FixH family protein [Candidatus Aminicenantes bacterium]|nr:FixH family protein [Candidatus Aminicenantes bacterium]HRY65862.1 FixH family protein [Candidatus Aminicenantes bacterium]HRZ72812.1 FixH family protein [Candidatus Aminicenantes bacterium]